MRVNLRHHSAENESGAGVNRINGIRAGGQRAQMMAPAAVGPMMEED